MKPPPDSPSPIGDADALIVGCGYLGRALARLLIAENRRVFGTTRRPDKTRSLAELGVRPLIADITQPLTLASLRPALECEALAVFHLVPPGRPSGHTAPRDVAVDGLKHLLDALRPARVRRMVLASSTAVYGETGGRTIDADTPARPADGRTALLLESEQLWLGTSPNAHVVRFAGLYGPGRIIGLSAVREGLPIVGDPSALLNLVHVDDAAALLQAVAEAQQPGRVELGADGHPPTRYDYYRHLAHRLGVPPPRVITDENELAQMGLSPRLLRTTSKRCDNSLTLRRTGWRPMHRDYTVGLDACMQPFAHESRLSPNEPRP